MQCDRETVERLDPHRNNAFRFMTIEFFDASPISDAHSIRRRLWI